MLKASAGWEAMGVDLERQADELGSAMASLKSAWQGPASERAIASYQRMVTWLQYAAQHAHENSRKAAAQAAAHAEALGSTPSLPEIAANHITTAVLAATNFFGINTMPIGACEMDYFGRMWTQAATTMSMYQAATAVNTTFEPLEPPPSIMSAHAGNAAAEEAGVVALGSQAGTRHSAAAVGQAGLAQSAPESVESGQSLASLAPQLGSQADSTGIGAGVGGAEATVGSGTGRLGASGVDDVAQMGLVGAPPLSTHPMAGGSGPSTGRGLMYSQAVPGAGASAPRTAMMDQLIGNPAKGAAPAEAGPGSSAGGGAAPMSVVGAGVSSNAGAQTGVASSGLMPAPDDGEDEW